MSIDLSSMATESDYPIYRSSADWKRIFQFLRRGYWHVTSPGSWNLIRETGAIRPNIDGRFPFSFDTTSERSYSHKMGLVALFDFLEPSEEAIIRTWGRAWNVLTHCGNQTTVLLLLDREQLRSSIIPNGWYGHGYIPHVEVWYPTDIPVTVVTECFKVPLHDLPSQFCPEQIGLTESVETVRPTERIEDVPWGELSDEQALHLIWANPAAPIPSEVIVRFPDLFLRDDSNVISLNGLNHDKQAH